MTSTNPARRAFAFVRRNLYVQVLIAVAVGITLGIAAPHIGADMKPFGDGFIALIKMTIGLVIFFTVVSGIAGIENGGQAGRVGGTALIYFEIVGSIALLIGLLVANVFHIGSGFDIRPDDLDAGSISQYTASADESHSLVDFLLGIIPKTIVSAFVEGNVLPVVFVAVLLGFVLRNMGEKGKPLKTFVDAGSDWIFGAIGVIMRFAPIGAFGAMAYTVGEFGLTALGSLLTLIGSFYATSVVFVFVVLGAIGLLYRFNILLVLRFIRKELLLVLATSSSDAVLPTLMRKLEGLGCRKSTVGLVMPTGYVFNSDGTNIYMTMGVLFIANATGTHLTVWHQLTILFVGMLTTKGSAGAPGAGFVAFVATLALVPHIPLAAAAVLLGIDRFLSECRAIVNVIGNVVATLVISRREREITPERLRDGLRDLPVREPVTTA